MSRVPTFAVVGKMGLPIAAAVVGLALWSSVSWATTGTGVSQTASSSDQLSARPAGVSVAVGVPSVVFGAADGLPKELTSPRQQAVVSVWLAAGSPASTVTVTTSAGEVRGCRSVALHPATVNTLHCTVIPGHARSLTLTVRTSVAGQAFQRSYGHQVRQ